MPSRGLRAHRLPSAAERLDCGLLDLAGRRPALDPAAHRGGFHAARRGLLTAGVAPPRFKPGLAGRTEPAGDGALSGSRGVALCRCAAEFLHPRRAGAPALYDAGQRPSPGLLVLAGLSAALAAWTKNEGAMFLAIVLIVRTLLAWRRDGGRAVLGQAGTLLAGAGPSSRSSCSSRFPSPRKTTSWQGRAGRRSCRGWPIPRESP